MNTSKKILLSQQQENTHPFIIYEYLIIPSTFGFPMVNILILGKLTHTLCQMSPQPLELNGYLRRYILFVPVFHTSEQTLRNRQDTSWSKMPLVLKDLTKTFFPHWPRVLLWMKKYVIGLSQRKSLSKKLLSKWRVGNRCSRVFETMRDEIFRIAQNSTIEICNTCRNEQRQDASFRVANDWAYNSTIVKLTNKQTTAQTTHILEIHDNLHY